MEARFNFSDSSSEVEVHLERQAQMEMHKEKEEFEQIPLLDNQNHQSLSKYSTRSNPSYFSSSASPFWQVEDGNSGEILQGTYSLNGMAFNLTFPKPEATRNSLSSSSFNL